MSTLCQDYIIDSDDDIIFSWKIKQWFNCNQADLLQLSVVKLGFKLVDQPVKEPCLICKENRVNHLITLKCNHFVCLNCFIGWFLEIGHSFNCVLCNQSFETIDCAIGI